MAEDLQAKAKGIIDIAVDQLMAMGMSKDGAAALLVVQGTIRIEDRAKRQEMADFVAESAEPPIDE